MSNNYYKILGIRNLTISTFVIEIERKGMKFEPGQHILLGRAGDIHHREYSIYSGVDDETLEVLVKEVEDGEVSKGLKCLKPGDEVEVQGPLGFFTLEEDYNPQRYVACTSRDKEGDFHGRLTDYIKQNEIEPHTHCFLCGNFEMIHDAMNLLEEKGVPQDHLHAEVYF